MVLNDRINVHKLKYRVVHLNIRKHMGFFTVIVTMYWHSLPREIVESPSLLIFESHMDMVQGNTL